jgi:hypothetical protein
MTMQKKCGVDREPAKSETMHPFGQARETNLRMTHLKQKKRSNFLASASRDPSQVQGERVR